jgi:hypothetical protein
MGTTTHGVTADEALTRTGSVVTNVFMVCEWISRMAMHHGFHRCVKEGIGLQT